MFTLALLAAFISPDSRELVTFKNGDKGFKLHYTIKNPPEVFDFVIHGPQPIAIDGIAGHQKENLHVFHLPGGSKWTIGGPGGIGNPFCEDITFTAWFNDEPNDNWQNIKIKLNEIKTTPEQKINMMFMHEVNRIRGVVGCGSDLKGNYSIQIAECIPNINDIVKKIRALEARLKVTVIYLKLVPNHDYLIEEEP